MTTVLIEASKWLLKTHAACSLWKERKPHAWIALYLESISRASLVGGLLAAFRDPKRLPLIPTSSPGLTALLFMLRPLTTNCSSGQHRTSPPVSLPQTQTLPFYMTAHHTTSLASTPFAPPAFPEVHGNSS